MILWGHVTEEAHEESQEEDFGSALLDSDERAAAEDYDSCNEDETAWARAGLVIYFYFNIYI